MGAGLEERSSREIPVMYLSLDAGGKVVSADPACLGALGRSREEVVGRPLGELLAPGQGEKLSGWLALVLSGRSVRGTGLALLRKDGSRLEAVLGGVRAEGPEEGDGLVECVVHDITGRKGAEEALARSEARYRGLVDTGGAGMAVTDIEGVLTFVNRRLCDLAGRAEEELVGRHFADLLHPEDLGRVMAVFLNAPNDPTARPEVEFRLLRPDGSTVHCLSSPTVLWDDGQIGGFNAIVQDITALRRAEEVLSESEQRYRELVGNLSDIVFELRPDGTMAYISPQVTDVLGHSPDELVGGGLGRLVHPESLPALLDALSGVTEPGQSFSQSFRAVHRGGYLVYISAAGKLARVKGGTRIVGLMKDVTRVRLAEEALRESEQRFRRLFESSPEGVAVLSREGRVLEVNDAALEQAGSTRSGTVGMKFQDAWKLRGEDIERWTRALRGVLEGSPTERVELRLMTEEREAWLEAVLARLELGGRTRAVQVLLKDITDRKRAFRELMGQLLTHDLREGNLYLVKERKPDRSIRAFRELLRAGFSGIILTRDPEPPLKEPEGPSPEHLWLSETGGPRSLRPDAASVEKWLEALPRGKAVLIERLDYLVHGNGFPRVLELVQRAREVAHLAGHVVLLSIDPVTLQPADLRKLEAEALEVVPKERRGPREDMMEVLRWVHHQNRIGEKPNLLGIGRGLRLSKPTARKRVRALVRSGYLVLESNGRSRVAGLTEKGRRSVRDRGTGA